MSRAVDVTTSVIASTLRGWRGTTGSKRVQLPPQRPVLFDREGDPQCRLVREALTELNLDADIRPVPVGGSRHLEALRGLAGTDHLPFLFDPNTGGKHTGADAIIAYLFRRYANSEPPQALKPSVVNTLSSSMASRVRGEAGINVRGSRTAEKMLTLYSFESSPYSRLVRERLCELEIAYTLVNLGKQQRSDMGPAKARWTLKPYQPLSGTKRDAFFQRHGDVMVPYLEDPNTGTGMFESADILAYLDKQYSV